MIRFYFLTGIIALLLASNLAFAQDNPSAEAHDQSQHCQHFPDDCESNDHDHSANNDTPMPTPQESGQAIFGALSEVNKLIEENEMINWATVDIDALWEHLQDMNALMTGVNVDKVSLANGLKMRISGTGAAKKAMDNMLPAHSTFLKGVRPDWNINLSSDGSDYVLVVTSAIASEIQRIKALGFSGFMVQDDHHAAHHLSLALGEEVHMH